MDHLHITQTPLAAILAHDSAYWSCISTVEERNGWKLFHNVGLHPRIDPNHAAEFRASADTGPAIVQQIVDFYRGLGVTPAAFVDCLATPTDLIAHLLAAGFVEWDGALNDLMPLCRAGRGTAIGGAGRAGGE